MFGTIGIIYNNIFFVSVAITAMAAMGVGVVLVAPMLSRRVGKRRRPT